MDKRLVYQIQATRLNLGMVRIKKIQDLVYWVYDCQNRSISLDVADFMPGVLWNEI